VEACLPVPKPSLQNHPSLEFLIPAYSVTVQLTIHRVEGYYVMGCSDRWIFSFTGERNPLSISVGKTVLE